MVDVFISYSRSDQPMVAMLARAVEAAGYDVWWDAELPPHQSYGDVITEKVASAKAAIVVWSASAAKSEWVRAEADMARNQRKLIQTAIDDVMPPLPFNQIQYAEMGDWRGEDDHPGWRKVKLSLADLCGQRGTAEPSTPRVPPPPQYQPQPTPAPAPTASRWPLFAGIGIAVVALAVAGGMLLGRGSNAPATPPSSAAPVAAPAPAVAAPQPEAAAPTPSQAVPAPVLDPDQEAALKPNPADMEFPDSSTRLLTAAEVMSKGPTTLRIARNEIYARKGRKFNDPWLRDWFSRYTWYKPLYDQVQLTPTEQSNVDLLAKAEARYGG
ncbi:TIR domain-containing protein [Novosphingobium sp. G106]|uniref:TIR domain-containing protein n=1 Tax=Novosphingobium sp. G106 TaxID=2849500 RepID=UPI001C2CE05D|nr:TIR domain-containing protein [Novosphingobium sp. G106]MBV1689909.1 TIR domain-containing protein [Novosphingobium sp. G106]